MINSFQSGSRNDHEAKSRKLPTGATRAIKSPRCALSSSPTWTLKSLFGHLKKIRSELNKTTLLIVFLPDAFVR